MSETTTNPGKITERKLRDALSWAYEKALNPEVPGIYSAYDLAERYKKNGVGSEADVRSLMLWLNAKAATAVFFCKICGLMKMPESLPANISSVLFTQIRIIAALAIVSGLDVGNDRVRALVFAGVCGDVAKDILKSAGIKLHHKLSMETVNNLSIQALTKLNRNVCFRLIAKLSEKGVVRQSHTAPFVGEIVGETFEALESLAVGKAAKAIFIDSGRESGPVRIFSKAS